MSKFVISGDTHGTLDLAKVKDHFSENEGRYTEDDYLIILGDVGVCGFDPRDEREVRPFLKSLPVTTLFIDGNHENFDALNSYGVDEWNGGRVHIIENNIIHLMRGQVFDIGGTKFFTFGGACSTDKEFRRAGVTWFPEEIPAKEEYEEGWENLEKADFSVDYILTHTGPREVIAAMGYGEWTDRETELRQYLQRVADNTDFTAWYFGHFHADTEIEDTFLCLYDELVVI